MAITGKMNPNIPCPCGSGKKLSECHKSPVSQWEFVGHNYLGEPVYVDKLRELATKQLLDELEEEAYQVENRQHAIGLLDRMYSVISPGIESLTAQSSCRKGCAACCYQAIPATPLETARIKKYMEHHVNKETWIKNINVLKPFYPKASQDETFKEAAGAYFFEGRPCPFLNLEDNTCGIYPVRPITCLTHIVMTDPAICHSNQTANIGMLRSAVYSHQTMRITAILSARIYPYKKPDFLVHLF
jgi:Fe-S-cluster containining protein